MAMKVKLLKRLRKNYMLQKRISYVKLENGRPKYETTYRLFKKEDDRWIDLTVWHTTIDEPLKMLHSCLRQDLRTTFTLYQTIL